MGMPKLLALLVNSVGTGSRLSQQELDKAVYMAKRQLANGNSFDNTIDSITSYFHMGVIDTFLLTKALGNEGEKNNANYKNIG